MGNDIIFEGSSIDEAISLAAKELEVLEEDIQYEILEQAEKRLFGKKQLARIKVWIEANPENVLDVDIEEEVARDSEMEPEEQAYFKCPEYLSEEELDSLADNAMEVLRSVLVYFNAADVEIDEYEGEEGELILDVVGENLAVLIGRHGRTLDALQFVVSSIVNKRVGFRYPLVIDIEGYKQRRRQKLESVAKSSAARAIRQKRDVRLRPMTPYERRIIHVALKDDPRIATSSEGKEPNRQVIIKVL